MVINKLFWTLIAAGLIIRLVVMPISTHSDLFAINMFPPLLFEERVVDIFSYINNFASQKNFSYYPPLTYYTFGLFHLLLHFFTNSPANWMDGLRNVYLKGFAGQAVDFIRSVPDKNIYIDLFLLKLPYLLSELLIIFILLRLAKKKLLNNWQVVIWIFNPVILYTTYLFGQFDIIALLFILMGFITLRKNKEVGLLLLGIAGALKVYPFLIVIPTALIFGKDYLEKAKLLLISFSPFAVSVIPTLINNPSLTFFAFFPKNIFHYKSVLSGWSKYSQFIKYAILGIFYLVLLLFSNALKIKDKWKFSVGIGLVTFLLVLTFAGRTHFHYLIWEMPLVTLWFAKKPKEATILITIQALSFASYKLLANQLQLGLFSPLNPNFSGIPALNDLINKVIPYRIISTAGFTIFTLVNICLILSICTEFLFRSKTLVFNEK